MPDLGLVVDTTKSLKESNIPVLKEILSLLVKEFDISENKTHVSLETFNKEAQVHNMFNDPNYWSVDAVLDLINTSIDKLKQPTRLDYALEKANGTMFTEANGDRPGDRNVMVMFTDGRTHENTDLVKYEAYLKALKVIIIQVALFSKPIYKSKVSLKQRLFCIDSNCPQYVSSGLGMNRNYSQ